MKTLVDLFNFGMLREYPEIIPSPVDDHLALNIGPGNKHVFGAKEIEYPAWDAEKDVIPFPDNYFDIIHCYHFLEHIANTVGVMSEMHRVLKPGGHINIVVPYYNSHLQSSDPDHKTAFTERSWRVIFDSSYYSKGKIEPMEIATNFIMGDEEKNLSLFTQLRKPG